MKNKNIIYALCACALCLSQVVFGELCLNAAISGFELWLCAVMPSVFPFFVCVSLLRTSGLIADAGSPLALFFGCALSGAPAGSRLCSQLAEEGILPEGSLTEYCAVCNMVSPAFFTGSLFVLTGSRTLILPVMAGHYLSALIWLIIISARHKMKRVHRNPTAHKFSSALTASVTDGFLQSVKICGVIVFFTVVAALIVQSAQILGISLKSPVFLFFLSLIEMTNGTAYLSGAIHSFPLLCALLSFCVTSGGACIMLQTMAVCDIEPKKYLLCKSLSGITAGIIAFLAANLIPVSVSASAHVEKALSQAANGALSAGIAALCSCIACGCVWLLFIRPEKSPKKRNPLS